jgi:hypothetical protein
MTKLLFSHQEALLLSIGGGLGKQYIAQSQAI